MFCSFCYGAGRDDFNSHNVRNNYGVVTCMFLQSIQCPVCFQYGHTKKNCNSYFKKDTLIKKDTVNKKDTLIKKDTFMKKDTVNKKQPCYNNTYALLNIDRSSSYSSLSDSSLDDNPVSKDNTTNNVSKITLNNGDVVTIYWGKKSDRLWSDAMPHEDDNLYG